MPSISLSPSSIQFPDVTPGAITATPGTVEVTVNDTVASLTMAIAGAPAGVFSAQLISTAVGHNRDGSPNAIPTVLASTDGSGSGTFTSPLYPPTSTATQLTIAVSYKAPAAPVPEKIQGTLNVTWPGGGSAAVGLLLYVSQITPSVGSKQPIQLPAGGSVNVPIIIDYESEDGADLQVNVAVANAPSAPTAGLTIGSGQGQLPAIFVSGLSPGGGTRPGVLDPNRSTMVKLAASAAKTMAPGNATAYYNVTAPNFPLLGTGSYQIAFAITPRPLSVTVTTPSLAFATNKSATLGLTIATDGAAGELNFGQLSATYAADGKPASIDIAWANPYGFGGAGEPIGGSMTGATVTSRSKVDGLVKVTVPYTAYNGLLKGNIAFEVNLLPYTSTIVINQTIAPHKSATGSMQLTLNENGNVVMSGSLNRNESIDVPGDDLTVLIQWIVTDSKGHVYDFVYAGQFLHNWQPNAPGFCPTLQQKWDDLMPSYTNALNYAMSDDPSQPTGQAVFDQICVGNWCIAGFYPYDVPAGSTVVTLLPGFTSVVAATP